MENIKLSIYDKDMEYGLALGEALSLLRNHFLVTICEELPEANSYDVLLTSQLGGMHFERAIRLTESREGIIKDLENLNFVLFKYSSSAGIAADITLFHSLITGKKQVNFSKEGCMLVAFCSSRGGMGKSTIAMGLSQMLIREGGKKVLYLSFEEIESTMRYMQSRENDLRIGEYLYYLMKDKEKAPDPEGFMVWNRDGVKAFCPDRGKNRLKELSIGELALFFDVLVKGSGFSHIVIEMGECFSEEALWVLFQCSRIAVLMPQEERGKEEAERFLHHLDFALGKGKQNDLIQVYSKVLPMIGQLEREEPNAVFIDWDQDSVSWSEGQCELSIDQDFGAGIRVLYKAVMRGA